MITERSPLIEVAFPLEQAMLYPVHRELASY